MHYAAFILFAALCLLGLVRPLIALTLLFVMFALKVSLQADISRFRDQPALTNFIVAGVILVATMWTIMRHPKPLFGHATSSLAIVVGLLGWSIISFLWSPTQSLGLNEGVNIIKEGYPYFIVYVLMGPILVTSIGDWRRASTLMLIVGSLVALSIVMSPEFSVRSGRIGVGLEGIQRTSPLAIAQMGGMLAIFGALSAGGRVTGFQTTIRVGAFVCGALLALFSGTRGQAVFALLAIALFLPVSRRLKRLGSYFSLVGIGLVVAIGAYVTFNYVLGQADTDRWRVSSIADATAIRQWSAFHLLAEFLQSPQSWIVGLGYNAFSNLDGVGDLGYVHNLYVEVLCELGIPAFVLLTIFFVRAGKASMGLFNRYREHPAERSAVSILMAMVFYQGMIATKEGNLWSAWNLFTFALILIRLDLRASTLGDSVFEEEAETIETEFDEDAGLTEREPNAAGAPA